MDYEQLRLMLLAVAKMQGIDLISETEKTAENTDKRTVFGTFDKRWKLDYEENWAENLQNYRNSLHMSQKMCYEGLQNTNLSEIKTALFEMSQASYEMYNFFMGLENDLSHLMMGKYVANGFDWNISEKEIDFEQQERESSDEKFLNIGAKLLKLFNKYRATFDKEIPYFIDYEIAMIEQGFCADYLKILQLFCSESSRLDIKFSRDDIELIQVIIKDIRCFWQEPEDIEALENVFKLLCE
ncbi:MAG: hypothetical protein J6M05_04845 [Cardiobacteriaceae bacterium]|nr:hypothetical protein [Cardiobacteriaceae bacterium]